MMTFTTPGSAGETGAVIHEYNYLPLEDENAIRLLHLEPTNNPDSPIRATLQQPNLVPQSSYEALSYTWGEPIFTHHVDTPDGRLNITENLHAALRQLRQTETSRILWIDAICINQSDDIEKGQQVTLMGEIYKKASAVLVWLGLASPETSKALEFLSNLSARSEDFGIEGDGAPRMWLTLPEVTSSRSDTDELLKDAISSHVGILLNRSWFARLWIVQESVLAKKLVIHCGKDKMDWKDFDVSMETLFCAMNTIGRCPHELQDIHLAWNLVKNRAEYQLRQSGGFFFTESKAFFSAVLKEMRDRQGKDDRDRVYAILALAEDDAPKITPDYTKTVAEVYTEFAIRYLGCGTLFDAGLCRRGPVPPNIASDLDSSYLPSWVPDLRPMPTGWIPIFGNTFATSAADRGHLGWTRSKNREFPAVLTAHGLRFDSIELIRGIGGSDFKPTREPRSFLTIVNYIKEMRALLVRNIEYATGEFAEISWAVTLAGGYPQLPSDTQHPLHGILGTHKEADEKLLNVWLHYLQFCVDENGEVHQKVMAEAGDLPVDFSLHLSEQGQTAWIFHRHLSSVLATHELFLTTQKYIGLAPPGTQSGDIVAVFGGPRMPFIIRQLPGVLSTSKDCCVLPHPRAEGEIVPYYVLLGPCYLHGIMHGEIYSERYAHTFEWVINPSSFGNRVPARVIHLL